MNHVRLATGLVLVVLLLALAPASMAQDTTFGLSQEDFAVYTAANASSAAAPSAQFDFTLNLTVSGADMAEPGVIDVSGTGLYGVVDGSPIFQLSFDASAVGEGENQSGSFEIRAVGDTIYFTSPELLAGEWVSLTGEEATTFAESFGGSMGLPVDPSEMGGDMSGMAGMSEMMTALGSLQPADYISMTRNGEQFTTNIALSDFLSSPEFSQLMSSAMAMSGEGGMEAGDFSEISKAIQNANLSLDQYVGPDNLINRATLNLDLTVDPAAVGEVGEAATIALVFDINLTGYNENYSVEAPATSTSLFEMMGGMMGEMN